MADRKKDGASSSKTSQAESQCDVLADEGKQRKTELMAKSNKPVHVPMTSSKSNPLKRMRTQDTTAEYGEAKPGDETNRENNQVTGKRRLIASEQPSCSGGGYQKSNEEVPSEKHKAPSRCKQPEIISQCSINQNYPISNDGRKVENCEVKSSSNSKKQQPESPIVQPEKGQSSSSFCPACGAQSRQKSEKLCDACKNFGQHITKQRIELHCSKNKSCEVRAGDHPIICLYCLYCRCLQYGKSEDPKLRPTVCTTKTNGTIEENRKLVMKPRESFENRSITENKKRQDDSHAQSQPLENVKNSQNEETGMTIEHATIIENIIRVYNTNSRYDQQSEDFIPKEFVIEIRENETMTRVEAWKNYSLEIEKDIDAAVHSICVLDDGLGTYEKTILFKESAFLIHLIRWNTALKPDGLLLPDDRLISLESLNFLYGPELVNLFYKFNGRIRELKFTESDLAMFATHILYKPIPSEADVARTDRGKYIDAQLKFSFLYSLYRETQNRPEMSPGVVAELSTTLEKIQEQFRKMIAFLKPYEYMFPKNTSFETFYGLRPLFRSNRSQKEISIQEEISTNNCIN